MKSKCMQVLFVGKRLNSDEKHFTVCTVYLVENIFGNTEDSLIFRRKFKRNFEWNSKW